MSYNWVADAVDEEDALTDPCLFSWEKRRKLDIWEFGKLLSMLAKLEHNNSKLALLQELIADTINQDPHLRPELSIIIAKLEQIAIIL
jgi:hypothetical protein